MSTFGAGVTASHELTQFMDQVAHDLAAEYERIRRRSREDPGTAGDEGEENWRSLLHDWLPPNLPIVTKGRILSAGGNVSPQVDVIVLSPSYPRKLQSKKVYLAGGVLAAFECKLTLRPEHIRKCVDTAKVIRSLADEHGKLIGTPYRELYSPITYGILAHNVDRETDAFEKFDALIGRSLHWYQHPRDLIDVICVATLSSWQRTSAMFLPPPAVSDVFWDGLAKGYKLPGGAILTQYSRWNYYGKRPSGSALRALFEFLLERLARQLPETQNFARYWARTRDEEKLGDAANSRKFPVSVLSENLQARCKNPGVISDKDFWSEWRMSYF